jgi:hypothetical protein
MIRYFISYMFQASGSIGGGNCEISLPQPITSLADVRIVTEYLRRQGLNNPIVMSFSRFDATTADGGTTR